MSLFSNFHETIILKKETDLQKQFDALSDLVQQYPDNKELLEEYKIAKYGNDGEDEIAYQLEKSNIGMYVLRDLNFQYGDQTAQVDFIVITPIYRYLIECKNIAGNITVTEKGDFIKSYTYNGRTITEGMESPLRQVEAQREVIRKIGDSQDTKLDIFLEKVFKIDYNKCRRTLVVQTNKKSILDTSKAPDNIKYKIIKSDNLIRQIQYDIDHADRDDYPLSKEKMEKIAQAYLKENKDKSKDWYAYYKDKYNLKEPDSFKDNLKTRLIALRKKIAAEKNIPAYYVFNNEEMDKLLEIHPKTLEELKRILPDIKIKCHGERIIQEINKYISDDEIL